MKAIRFTTADGTLIRDAVESDLVSQDNYFADATDEFLLKLGVDPSMVRDRTRDFGPFRELQKIPLETREIHLFTFERAGVVIGSSTLKAIRFGESAEVHGHLYDESLRGKGAVSGFIREYLKLVFETFQLQKIIAEPSVQNVAPNRVLEKFGAKLVGTFERPATGILLARTANRYEITAANLF
ncbi:MAG: N-acetyltransferase [Proteobacteria bacterium]|nr:MAG: N-acetyltransferase [Pseudomonadota bacterium]